MSSEKFDVFSTKFAQDIYLQKYSMNQQESWADLSRRVVTAVCGQLLDSKDQEKIYKLILDRKFIPGGRYLYSAGRPFHQVNNCFLFRAEDSREGWADAMQKATSALMTGGGIGFDYSALREEGALIRRTGGKSTGPLALMQMVNEAGRHIMQGGQRRCLPRGSMVHTKKGLVPIEEVRESDEVLTFDGYRKVKATINQGYQRTVKIITQNGELICTPNHRVARLRSVEGDYEWVEAQHLLPEDRLIHTNEQLEGVSTDLPPSDYVRSKFAYTVKEITIPKLDTDIAWFIGYFHANGHVRIVESKKGKRNGTVAVSVPNDAEEVIFKIKKQLERFGIVANVKDGDGECKIIKTASIPLALWIEKNIKKTKTSLNIPKFILNGTKNIRASYIAGMLDGDGCVSGRPVIITNTVYPEYAKQLQNLCSSLGIVTKFSLNRPPRDNWKALYRLILKGSKQVETFVSSVGNFLVYKKFEQKELNKEQHSYSFPGEMVRRAKLSRNDLHQNYNVNYPVERMDAIFGKLKYTPVSVLEIEDNEVLETFDIEVDDRNEFYCNGFLVHNSAIYASLNWKHPDVYKFMNCKNHSPELRAAKEKDFNFPLPMELTNISVNYDTEFFIAIEDENHPLHAKAKEVFEHNCRQAFSTAEPGFSFNHLKDNETLRNACTEVVSEDDSDKCNLGTLWINRFKDRKEFAEGVKYSTLFLLCGAIYSDVPNAKIKEVGDKNNRIGLGLGGIHEWLMLNGGVYACTPELHKWLRVYEQESDSAAFIYAKQLGVAIPKGKRAIAPTGTIGILAETTTGIEPLFCKAYKRRYFKDGKWMSQLVVDGSVKRLLEKGISIDKIQDSYDLSFKERVKFQADVQNYVDMAISSTCNLPPWGSPENNEETLQKNIKILLKYAKRLRGFTCYPDSSRGGQPLTRVPLEEALKQEGVVFEENETSCVNGVCGI